MMRGRSWVVIWKLWRNNFFFFPISLPFSASPHMTHQDSPDFVIFPFSLPFLHPSLSHIPVQSPLFAKRKKKKKKEVHSWWEQDASLHIVFCKHTLALKTALSLQKQNMCKKSRTVHSRHRDETTCRIRWCECKSVTQEPLVNPCAPLLHTVTGVPACLFSLFTGGQVCDEWGP